MALARAELLRAYAAQTSPGCTNAAVKSDSNTTATGIGEKWVLLGAAGDATRDVRMTFSYRVPGGHPDRHHDDHPLLQVTMTTRRGFTLIELMIGLILLLAVGGVTYQLLVNTQRVSRSQTQHIGMQDNVRSGALIMANELREVGYDQITATGLPLIQVKFPGRPWRPAPTPTCARSDRTRSPTGPCAGWATPASSARARTTWS